MARDSRALLLVLGEPKSRQKKVLKLGYWPCVSSKAPSDCFKFTIGRSPDADEILVDVNISRQHARFEFDGECWNVCDLGSANGVRVNGRPVQRQQCLLTNDVVSLGPSKCQYSWRFQIPAPDSEVLKKLEQEYVELRREQSELKAQLERRLCEERLRRDKARLAAAAKKRRRCEEQELIRMRQKLFKSVHESLRCCVCDELFVTPMALNCGHIYCHFCLKQWQTKCSGTHQQEKPAPATCPECRAPISVVTRMFQVEGMIDSVMAEASPESREERRRVVDQRGEEEAKFDHTHHHHKLQDQNPGPSQRPVTIRDYFSRQPAEDPS